MEKLLAEERVEREEQGKESKRKRVPGVPAFATGLKRTPKDLIGVFIIGVAVVVFKLSFTYSYVLPGWDPCVYLLNARRFFYGYDPLSFFELLRPPLLPAIISLLWSPFGENYLVAAAIQPVFTVLAGFILYVIVRQMFDWGTAMLSFLVFLFAPEVFRPTNLLLTHGVELPFALMCVFFAWKIYSEQGKADRLREYVYTACVGAFAALASLTRYPAIVFFPAVLALTLRRNVSWSLKWILICGFFFVATWAPWLRWNMVNAGGDPFASVKAAFFVGAPSGAEEMIPWYYYLTSLVVQISIVGVVLFLAGIADREAFRDRKKLMFVCWFALATGANSVIPNKQLRFMVEWFPAISVLVALGARRIQRLFRFKSKALFNLLLASWLVYLVWSSNVITASDVNMRNDRWAKEVPTVVSWMTVNMAKDDIGASDVFAPQLSYFAKRMVYSFSYVQDKSVEDRITLREVLAKLNVTFVIVTFDFAKNMKFENASYLVTLKDFWNFVAYAVIDGARSKHLGVLLVRNPATSALLPSGMLPSRLAIEETLQGILPRSDVLNSNSFFSKLEDAYADGSPKYGLIILPDEMWDEASQKLSLEPSQLSVLRTLVEKRGTALLTSGKATRGWLSEVSGIQSNGVSTFLAFSTATSKYISDWASLLGGDRTWSAFAPSQVASFPTSPPGVETIVEANTETGRKTLVWIGYQGNGRVAHFCCSASDLSYSSRMKSVNPVLIRVLLWLLDDYPRILKGTGFKVALRIDDAHAALYTSIEKHASALLYEKKVPLSLAVIPKDLSNATAALLRSLRQDGCELTLHGAPGHYDLTTSENQTEALLAGKEMFKKYLGGYPTILAPPGLSYNIVTIRAAERAGLRAISGSTIESKPPAGRGNHFGYSYDNTTVVMLPALPLLDSGPYGDWSPSAEVAITRTKWLLASQRWLKGSCIVTLHFNDSRIPEIVRLVDWAKTIGAQFTTMEQMLADTFMSPTLEGYSPFPDTPSFSKFDITENARFRAYRISFTLNHSIKLRTDMGRDVEHWKVNGKTIGTTGPLIVTETLDAGKEHVVIVRVKP